MGVQIVGKTTLPLEKVVYDPACYPREKASPATIAQYVDALRAGATFPPIEVEAGTYILLDGYHRLRAYHEAGLREIEVVLVQLNGIPRLLYAAGKNATHGDRLTAAEKKAVARQLAEAGVPEGLIKEYLQISLGTVSAWVSDIVARRRRQREARIWWLHLLGWRQTEIADQVGVDQSGVSRTLCTFSELKKRITDQASRGRSVQEIAAAEDVPPKLVEALLLQGLDDQERFARLRIGLQPYDVWQFSDCDERFGLPYPGRIPGQLALHVLFFYTQPGDLVLDPMAGGGTMVDACAYLGRRCYAYDAHPHPDRFDIRFHDLRDGWPPRTREADLIFWDPPYFAKKDDAYGERSISRLDRDAYLAFFREAFARLRATVKPTCRLALLMSDWDPEPESEREGIFIWHYAVLLQETGWRPVRKTTCPLSTQQVHPTFVTTFRQARRLARLDRWLLLAVPR